MSNQTQPIRFQLYIFVCAAAIAMLALFSLAAWILDFERERTFGFNYMAPGVAVLFLLVSATLVIRSVDLSRKIITGAWIMTLVIAAVFGLLLLQYYISGLGQSIGAWLAGPEEQVISPPLWLVASPTPIIFLGSLIALTLAMHPLDRWKTCRQIAAFLAIAVIFCSLAGIFNYATKTPVFYSTRTIPMSILTAIGFVFLGAALLAVAGRDVWPVSMFGLPSSTNLPAGKRKLATILTVGFVFLAVVILAAGYLFISSTFSELRTRQRNELKDIADLKVRQISEWYRDAVSDAKIFINNNYARRAAQRILAGTASAGEKDELRNWVKEFLNSRKIDFEYLTLYDANGQPVISAPVSEAELPNCYDSEEFQAGLTTMKEVYIKDIHFEDPAITAKAGRPRICIWTPVHPDDSKKLPAIGIWHVEINPENFLFPFIQEWPTPSQTAETLLVRRDGDQVVFLNKLRHRHDTSLSLRFPVATSDQLPAAMAVLGQHGVVNGLDYRNVPVEAAIRGIPGTPWFIVSKIDTAEIYSRPREIAVFTGVFLLVLILLVYFSMGMLWNRITHDAVFNEKERLLVTLRSIGDGVIVTDIAGNVTMMNKVAEKLTGWPIDEAVGRPLTEIFNIINEDTGEPCENPVLKVIRTGLVVGLANHTILVRRDGSHRSIDDSGAPVRDRGGNAVGVVLVFRDVTEKQEAEKERKRLEQGIQQTQKLESLGILAGGIAHDFNNLLTGILGYSTLAIENLPRSSPVLGHIEEIEKSAYRAADLTRQLLAYSGKGRFIIEPINISAVVEDMAHLLEISISKKCSMKYDFAKSLPLVEADIAQIRQVVMNLILNASEAIGDNTGMITVSTGAMECDEKYLAENYLGKDIPAGRYVYLEVGDTGIGMTEEVKSRLFDPFFTTKFAGRGLGLAAALGIIRGHKGAIKVSSEPGKGSTFRVLLPAGKAAAQEPPKIPKQKLQKKGRGVVLVVDDEETIRTLSKKVLEAGGYTVLTAADGLEALEIFKTNTHDIRAVVLDLTMPQMDGQETFKEMHQIRPDVKVLLSSGYNEQDSISHFAGQGLAGFIQKPYTMKSLLEAVAKVMAPENSENNSQ